IGTNPSTSTTPRTTPIFSPLVADAEDLGMTLEELNEKYEALSGRFAEQEALVTQLNHKRIKWIVDVLSVGNCQVGVCVTFISTGSQFKITTAEFDDAFRQRL